MINSAKCRIARIPLTPAVVASSVLTLVWETVIIEVAKAADLNACAWSGAGGMGWIAAKHSNARPKFGSAQRDHMLAIEATVSIDVDAAKTRHYRI